MSKLTDLLRAPEVRLAEVTAYLDGLTPGARISASRGLDPAAQRRLWTLAEGQAVTFDELVPPDRGPLEPVRHFGRNTLPAFTEFEKRFCRPHTASSGVLWGYNEGATRPLVGPGYFVVRPTPGDVRGALVIDYERIPPDRPSTWPEIRPNERGVSRLVYAFMHDFLRRVSPHVSIGRAWRKGKQTDNYFTLCREG